MSLTYLAARCRPSCSSHTLLFPAKSRHFHGSSLLLAPRQAKKVVLTKAQRLALERKKAAKAPKKWYSDEKLPVTDAISVLRAVEVAAPTATYELTIKTAMGKGLTIPKGRYTLPREAKTKLADRILVFAEGRAADEARQAGADIVGGIELVEGVVNGTHQATLFLCTPDLVRGISPRLGRVLGPRGLMPSERRGTVTDDVAGYISKLKGTTEWTGDKEGTIRAPIAKLNFPPEDVVKNIRYFMSVVKRATGNTRDPTAKLKGGKNTKPVNAITKVVLSTRQGPGIQLSDY